MANSFADWQAYYYYPSAAAAAIFMLLFFATTFLHTYQLFRTRTWFFIPLLIGGFFEGIGYIGRLMSSRESPDWTLGPYVMQSTLLLVAPALFAASIYMTLGRIIVVVNGEEHSIIRVNWLTKIFVGGDILSFLMQSSGAGILVKDQESQEMGENIILGGLFVQIVFFCFFVVCAFIFRYRIAKTPTALSQSLHHVFRKHTYVLYATSVLIVVRSIIRVVEYIQGYDGYILSNEYFLYVFDALPMFFVLVFFNFVHPSEINCLLGRATKMTRKGGLYVTELEMAV